MGVRNIVKVMNFHALLRVNNARKKVDNAHAYEQRLSHMILSIINNRNFSKEQTSLKFPEKNKELNIYIGSDLGFCSSFNSDVMRYIREDNEDNDKIIIGKKIYLDVPNVVMKFSKEDYKVNDTKVFTFVLSGLLEEKYSKINLIYIHYYNMNKQEIVKKQILPINFEQMDNNIEYNPTDDYYIEGDLNYILWNLVTIYVSSEIEIAEAWSWASENVERQKFTNESLKKIDENEEIQTKKERKEKKALVFKEIVELNNKKRSDKKEEE